MQIDSNELTVPSRPAQPSQPVANPMPNRNLQESSFTTNTTDFNPNPIFENAQLSEPPEIHSETSYEPSLTEYSQANSLNEPMEESDHEVSQENIPEIPSTNQFDFFQIDTQPFHEIASSGFPFFRREENTGRIPQLFSELHVNQIPPMNRTNSMVQPTWISDIPRNPISPRPEPTDRHLVDLSRQHSFTGDPEDNIYQTWVRNSNENSDEIIIRGLNRWSDEPLNL